MYLDNGYWMIWLENNSRTQLHRWIAEQYLGRKLLTSEVVHHINGIKIDNRPENLQVKTRSEHTADHKKKAFDEVYEQRFCLFCQGEFFVQRARLRFKKRNTPYTFCSRSCGAKAQWQRLASIPRHSV